VSEYFVERKEINQ